MDFYLAGELKIMTMPDGITDGFSAGRPRTTEDTSRAYLTEFTTDRSRLPWTPRTLPRAPSKPLVGILGDVDGRIVPVAPPPFLNLGSDCRP